MNSDFFNDPIFADFTSDKLNFLKELSKENNPLSLITKLKSTNIQFTKDEENIILSFLLKQCNK